MQRYPDLGPRIRVSVNGGGEPRWSHDSKTLYFRETGTIYRATIVTEPNLDAKNLSPLPFVDEYDAAASGHQHYDLSRDGQRFLMVKHGRRFRPNRVNVIENWPSLLSEDRVP